MQIRSARLHDAVVEHDVEEAADLLDRRRSDVGRLDPWW
jgi:hypothetical protein